MIAVIIGLGVLEERFGKEDAGGVDEARDHSRLGCEAVNQRVHRGLVAQIDRRDLHLAGSEGGEFASGLTESARVAGDEEEIKSAAREAGRDGAADTGRAAENEGEGCVDLGWTVHMGGGFPVE